MIFHSWPFWRVAIRRSEKFLTICLKFILTFFWHYFDITNIIFLIFDSLFIDIWRLKSTLKSEFVEFFGELGLIKNVSLFFLRGKWLVKLLTLILLKWLSKVNLKSRDEAHLFWKSDSGLLCLFSASLSKLIIFRF